MFDFKIIPGTSNPCLLEDRIPDPPWWMAHVSFPQSNLLREQDIKQLVTNSGTSASLYWSHLLLLKAGWGKELWSLVTARPLLFCSLLFWVFIMMFQRKHSSPGSPRYPGLSYLQAWSYVISASCSKGWRRQRHPTPVLLPGKSHGQRSLWASVRGVAKSWTRLCDFTFTFQFHALEKEMATHSSVLAWRIPGMGEPVGLPSMGLHRVGHDWSDLAAVAAVLREWIILGDGSVVSCGFPELPDPYYLQAWGSREKQLLQLWTGVEACVFPPTPTWHQENPFTHSLIHPLCRILCETWGFCLS